MLPFWSPTTVRAAKLKRRPPLTTLAQRLMKTTFSIIDGPSPVFWAWSRERLSRRGPRWAPPQPAQRCGRLECGAGAGAAAGAAAGAGAGAATGAKTAAAGVAVESVSLLMGF